MYSWPRSWKGIEFQDYALSDGTRNDWGGNYPFQYVNRYLGWNYYNNNTTLDRDKYIGAFTLAYDITSWLNLTGRFGLDYTFDQSETRNKPADIAGLLDGFYQNQLSKDNVSNNDLLLTAYKDNLGIDGLDAKFSIGGAQFSRSLYWIRGKSGKWVNPWNYSTNNWEDPNTVTYTDRGPTSRREHRWEKAN